MARFIGDILHKSAERDHWVSSVKVDLPAEVEISSP